MQSAPRRLAAVAIAGLCAAGLAASAGCGTLLPAAATVRFPDHYTGRVDRADFEKELKALHDNKQFQGQFHGSGLLGAGKDTVDSRFAADWLSFVIHNKIISHEFDHRHLSVTAADTDAATSLLARQFSSLQVTDAFPKWFRDRLIGRDLRTVAVRSAVSGVDLSDAGLRKYYDSHQADFLQNCLSHILVKTKVEAEAALARLKGGEEFAAVAKSVSIDTASGAKGGDLGCNFKGAFVAEFDKVAGELPVGQLSDPVQTQYGWHIILVRTRRTASFDAAKDRVRDGAVAQAQGAFLQFLQNAVTTARVTVDPHYGTYQPPEIVPPEVPKPRTERSDKGKG